MHRKRNNAKNRRESGPFLAVPHAIIESEEYAELSAKAVKLLFDMYVQYRGNNNGDLAAAWKLMKPRGWKSRDTLDKAKNELLDSGFVMLSRQGGRNKCNLYALTFIAIDECQGKLDIKPTKIPPGTWRKNSLTRYACQSGTPIVSTRRNSGDG